MIKELIQRRFEGFADLDSWSTEGMLFDMKNQVFLVPTPLLVPSLFTTVTPQKRWKKSMGDDPNGFSIFFQEMRIPSSFFVESLQRKHQRLRGVYLSMTTQTTFINSYP